MRHVYGALVPTLLVLALLLLPVPQAEAAVSDCALTDLSDASNDVARVPVDDQRTDAVTGFGQLDLRSLCVAETAEAVHVILTLGASIAGDATKDFQWHLLFFGNGTAQDYSYRNNQGTVTSNPAGAAEVSGARLQFALQKREFPVGSPLTSFAVTSRGTFVPPIGEQVTGSDRMPAEGVVLLANYTFVGQRAPADADTDGDGLPDVDEFQRGTNPNDADSDNDGISDGDEVQRGTDPRDADSDNDGLTDGEEVARGMDPNADPDTDDDGLTDAEEITGNKNRRAGNTRGFNQSVPGSTNPANNDTDGDGLEDGYEVANDLDPNNPDSDGDGVRDDQEAPGGGGTTSPAPTGEGGAGKAKDVASYLPTSTVALAIVVLICVGGILWRWG